MQLPHALSNLLGCVRLPHARRGERGGVQVLLEPAVEEGPQQPRTDLLPRQTPKHAQFILAINQMLHLGPVDSQQNLGRLLLARFAGK